MRLELVGHALLKKLLQPRKPICAHVLLAAQSFYPLPVLGLPGWWPANEASDFYAAPAVFCPRRTARAG